MRLTRGSFHDWAVMTLMPTVLDRMVKAVEDVRERLLRSTSALTAAGVPYAIVGGNAVAAHVARVDEAGGRNTPDVNLLIRRNDLPRAHSALDAVGFVYQQAAGAEVFVDGPDGKSRQGVRIAFAGEKVREHELAANPDVAESELMEHLRVLSLDALVRMNLTAFRRIDRVHIRDMIDVGLIDAAWVDRLPPALGERLQAGRPQWLKNKNLFDTNQAGNYIANRMNMHLLLPLYLSPPPGSVR